MITDLFFILIILCFLIYYGRNSPSCGIPLFKWCVIFFIILACKSLSNLFRIVMIRRFFRWAATYSIIQFVVVEGVYLVWLIYGNIIFYSKENNCNQIENTYNLYILMFLLLIIGYFSMLLLGLVICFLPCIIYMLLGR
jgi:hypothetical protein